MLGGLRKDHTKRRRALWATAAGLTVVVFGVLVGFFFMEAREAKQNAQAQQAGQQETKNLIVEKVGALYQLPNEEPTVAQVQNKDQLEDQIFFSAAENGDYLLVYKEAKLALLYRERINKLVNVGPINLEGQNVAGDSTQR